MTKGSLSKYVLNLFHAGLPLYNKCNFVVRVERGPPPVDQEEKVAEELHKQGTRDTQHVRMLFKNCIRYRREAIDECKTVDEILGKFPCLSLQNQSLVRIIFISL